MDLLRFPHERVFLLGAVFFPHFARVDFVRRHVRFLDLARHFDFVPLPRDRVLRHFFTTLDFLQPLALRDRLFGAVLRPAVRVFLQPGICRWWLVPILSNLISFCEGTLTLTFLASFGPFGRSKMTLLRFFPFKESRETCLALRQEAHTAVLGFGFRRIGTILTELEDYLYNLTEISKLEEILK